MIEIDWPLISQEELEQAYLDAQSELRRRRTLATAEEQIAEVNRKVLEATGQKPGSEWVQPTDAQNSYPPGWIVQHNGKKWESLTAANNWEPGVSGWREVVPENTVPQWIQPTMAEDAYHTGDKVSWKGNIWISTADPNTWEPGVYGWTEAIMTTGG